MVDYLAFLGYRPSKIRGSDYWYLSPLRSERTASFKVNRHLNLWYDHGLGEGGTLLKFGVSYHRCTMRDFLQKLTDYCGHQGLSFQLPEPSQAVTTTTKKMEPDNSSKIKVTSTGLLNDPVLLSYLQTRAITLELARLHCVEVNFTLYRKVHRAIGFPNSSGGYELRNQSFKGSSSPKTFRFMDNGSKTLHVFEGFFDFLSWQQHFGNIGTSQLNFLILNSLSFFNKARPVMEAHPQINLWLDRGKAGQACTVQAIHSHAAYTDQSSLYRDMDDLNE